MELQGTVRAFDPGSRAGSVVLDDGRTVGFDGEAFDAGGLRLLRPGQRVRLRADAERATVTAVTLSTFLLPDE